tara:strand:- start:422 stop:736 length:315 start_codon:yes stop_codon:yes gene_type:complete
MLVLIILATVGIPLFAEITGNFLFIERDPKLEQYKHLLVRKEEILLSIKELEFDYKTGKLSQEDYKSSQRKLEAEALETLEEIDLMEKEHKTSPDKKSNNLEVT